MTRHKLYGVDFTMTGSPESLVTQSDHFHVARDSSKANPSTEAVSFSISGTWNSATVTLHQCVDTSASPLVFVPTALAYTANTAGTWTLPTDTIFRLMLTGHGSPVPNLNCVFKGDIDIADV